MRVRMDKDGWPEIGSGVRLVEVRKGRKWVHVREVHARKFTRRFPKSVWEHIEATGRVA